MRALAALIPGRQVEERYSLQQFVQDVSFTFGGSAFGGIPGAGPVVTTYGKNPAEPVGRDFTALLQAGMDGCPPVAAVEGFRMRVLSEARFLFQRMLNGRPGDLFSSADLELLEHPWPGGTTGDLIASMVLHADFAGNAFAARADTEIVLLRPDWVDIVLQERLLRVGGQVRAVGWEKLGYAFYQGGRSSGADPVVFLPDEVAHFAPLPDGKATWRGMSWLTPIIREIQADGQATAHKSAFLENAATPNLAVSMPREVTIEQFREFKKAMEEKHRGAANAGRTLYVAGGADVTVIGKDMVEMDFSGVVGKGETRIANAAGIHPVVLGFSEGMQGSSLNAGNYTAAKRSTSDGALRPAWRNLAGSLEVLFPPPQPGRGRAFTPARLWTDLRDVAFLRDDAKDTADVAFRDAQIIRNYTDAGFTPESAKACVAASYDVTLLQHSGLYSVQLQRPETGAPASATAAARSVGDEMGEAG